MQFHVSVKEIGEGKTRGASNIVKGKSSQAGKDSRATGRLETDDDDFQWGKQTYSGPASYIIN